MEHCVCVCACTFAYIFLSRVLSTIVCFLQVGASAGDRIECSLPLLAYCILEIVPASGYCLNWTCCHVCYWPFWPVFCVMGTVLSHNINKMCAMIILYLLKRNNCFLHRMLKCTFSWVIRFFAEKAVLWFYEQHSVDHCSQRGVAAEGGRSQCEALRALSLIVLPLCGRYWALLVHCKTVWVSSITIKVMVSLRVDALTFIFFHLVV